ncbi:two-component response regulator EHD1-like isoform X2 [Panicum hallii]|uniref:two-component response regulator EHD1-like isoform X2 n=1 Tax=Panicum hallii TaxID=206008 RepID=UPI000DF4D1C1|nr:two-component response regulator EHD1-like isoform X2 [Panicum hallii]
MDHELWPSGLRVLVIDNNSSYLKVMEELLIKCSYKVTIYNNVREAMSSIYGNQQTVDLIICDLFFPTEDSLLILQEVTSKFDIPTIIMSSNGDTSTVMKCITNGASDFLIKPPRIEELKNIWQHVFRKQIFGAEHRKCSNAQQHVDHQLSYRAMGITEEATATLDSEIRGNNGTVTDIRDLRKSRLSWTMQLHRQFIAAVNSLGADIPKKILEIMKVKHLTREQVASHLQKYRLHLRNSTQALHKDDRPSSSGYPNNESSILRTQLNSSSNSLYFDQDGCMEITDYSLPKDDLSSGSECILGERNNYSPECFQDFRWDSEKQGSETTTYLWNFEAE